MKTLEEWIEILNNLDESEHEKLFFIVLDNYNEKQYSTLVMDLFFYKCGGFVSELLIKSVEFQIEIYLSNQEYFDSIKDK